MDKDLHIDLSGLKSIEIPEEYRDHPLLNQRQPFFTLPSDLLSWIVHSVGERRFDSELLEMEFALSEICKDHDSRIGFWGRQPIRYQLLCGVDNPINAELIKKFANQDRNEAETRRALELANERLKWTADARRGYCGWLMTNPMFLDEHRQIFQTWKNEVAKKGIPNMGSIIRDADNSKEVERATGQTESFIKEFEDFFIRWRLDGMPAPFAPQPIGVHLPVMDLRPVLGHLRSGGTTFYIPDICSLPSRDKLREMLEEAVRNISPHGNDQSGHLGEWFEIVHSDNVAKNQLQRYARVFEIQHYMRALYARHAEKLDRKKSAVMAAFASFLSVGEDSIKGDIRNIANQLGPNWHLPAI